MAFQISPRNIAATPDSPRTSPSRAWSIVAVSSLGLLHAAAQAQCFLPAVHYGAGSNPCSVAVADYNSDGRPDLAVANFGDNSISVMLADPSVPGTFQAKVDHSVGAGPFFVATADFNWDGAQDLAVGNLNDNNISVLLGNGDGTFQPRVNYATGTLPNGVTIADFNWDGQLDLAIPNYGGTTVSILVGNGDGTFQAAADYAAGTSPTCIAAADFNWDGLNDLAVSNEGSNDVSVLLGDPFVPGTFLAPVNYAAGGGPESIASGDLNGDSIPDLAVANSSSQNASIFLGNGNGTFQPAANYATGSGPWSVALGDLDGDTRLDLAVANAGGNISVLLGNPGGTFQPKTDFAVGSSPLFVGASDLNGDGFLDLVSANVGSNDVSVLLGLDSVWYPDADGDTYGDAGGKLTTCTPPNGYVTRGGDCDDSNPAVNAGAAEVCGNGIDDDCDGKIDEGPGSLVLSVWQASVGVEADDPANGRGQTRDYRSGWGGEPLFLDLSADLGGGHSDGVIGLNSGGIASSWTHSMDPGHGHAEPNTNYIFEFNVQNDSSYSIDGFYQAVGEVRMVAVIDLWNRGTGQRVFQQIVDCSAVDPSMIVGQNPSMPGYHTIIGSPSGPLPAGPYRIDFTVFLGESVTNFGAQAQGELNLVISSVSFADADSDGYGDPGTTSMACPPPPGYVAIGGDCDDTNSAIHPGASELCNGLDDNCDGQIDEGLTPSTWYADADGDAYGDPATTVNACTQPNGYVAQAGDCDDTNAAVNPGATEVCDGLDNDCDGQTDEGLGTTWYADGDSDGYGDGASPLVACSQPGGYVAIAGDCDDGDAAIHPGAAETCNGKDDDCDGLTDEGVGSTWYRDADGDTYGDPLVQAVACAQPGGYVAVAGDCDDTRAAVHPGVAEVCGNGIDDNCDGQVDEGCCATSFQPQATYSSNWYCYGIAAGDFDGDGSPDLAVTQTTSAKVEVFLGNTNGTFKAAVVYAVGVTPISVAAGDFNGDHRLDLAVGNGSSNNVSILLGNGDGTFGSASNYAVGNYPASIAVGDFNKDAKADLAVANQNSGTVSVLLGLGNGAFNAAVDYGAGGTPTSVAIADFDHDSRPDLAVTDYANSSVALLFGNANGTFQAAVSIPAGPGPYSIAIGELNGDGWSDLVVANYANGTGVSVLLGGPNGAFQAPVGYASGNHPSSVALGDFNGDGGPDIVSVNNNMPHSVSVLIGNANGTFQSALTYATGTSPIAAVVGEFNGDGRPDFALTNYYSPYISVYLNSSTGSTWYADLDNDGYGDSSSFKVACTQPPGYRASAGDCDDADAATHPGATEICDGKDNDCNGTPDDGLNMSTWYADADGDSYGDPAASLLACSQPGGYVAVAGDCDDGDAAINPGATETCNNIDDNCNGQTDEGLGQTWYADADGDGYGDTGSTLFTCAQPNGYVAIGGDCDDLDAAINPGAAEICNGVDDDCNGAADDGLPINTWYADQDGDGYGDPATAYTDCFQPNGYVADSTDCDDTDPLVNPSALEVCSNNIDDNCDGRIDEDCCPIAFQAAKSTLVGGAPVSLAALDYNGDGRPDIAVANSSGNSVVLMAQQPNGSFQKSFTLPVGANPAKIVSADLNGDGFPDLAAACSGTSKVSVTLARGDGTYLPELTYGVGTQPAGVAAADFDGDGKLDLAVANSGNSRVSVLKGLGNGAFGTHTPYIVGNTPRHVIAADFDGDGHADIAAANSGSNTVSVLMGKGDGTFKLPRIDVASASSPGYLVAADFNKDGKLDLAVLGYNRLYTHAGNGDGTFKPGVQYTTGAGGFNLAIADLDGDPYPDLALSEFYAGTFSILRGKADGTFDPRVSFNTNQGVSGLIAADIDRDGRADLVTANQNTGYISVRLNDGGTWLWYPDSDADGFGDPGATPVRDCLRPLGLSAAGTDCDDSNPAIHPGARDICDGIDNDCDGVTNENGDPVITFQPLNTSAKRGATAKFSVSDVGGTGYQWRRNGYPMIGETNNVLIMNNVDEGAQGQYDVIVSNSCGQVTSFAATLSVQPLPPTNLQGAEVAGGKVTLTWVDNSQVEFIFKIARSQFTANAWQPPVEIDHVSKNTVTYTDTPPPGVWRYRVCAFNQLNSEWTAYAEIRPAAPSGLTAQKTAPGKAKLSWTDNSNFEASFTIERQKFDGVNWGSPVTLPTQGANVVTCGDSPGAGKYRYRIRATNAAGSSVWVGWVSIQL